MASVPGISSAQRFKTSTDAIRRRSPCTAWRPPRCFRIRITQLRGMGEWLKSSTSNTIAAICLRTRLRARCVGTDQLLVADRDEAAPGTGPAMEGCGASASPLDGLVAASRLSRRTSGIPCARGPLRLRPVTPCYKPAATG